MNNKKFYFFRNISNSHLKKLNIIHRENISLKKCRLRFRKLVRTVICIAISFSMIIAPSSFEHMDFSNSYAAVSSEPIKTNVIVGEKNMGVYPLKYPSSSESVNIGPKTAPIIKDAVFLRAYILGSDGLKYFVESIKKDSYHGDTIFKVTPLTGGSQNIDLYYTDNNNPPIYCEYVSSRKKINIIYYADPKYVSFRGPDSIYLQDGETTFTYTIRSPRGSKLSTSLKEVLPNGVKTIDSKITKLMDISTPDNDIVEYQATVPKSVKNNIIVNIDYSNRERMNIYNNVTSEGAYYFRDKKSMDQWRGGVGHNYDYKYYSINSSGYTGDNFNLENFGPHSSVQNGSTQKGNTLNYTLTLNNVSSVINNDNSWSSETFSNALSFLTLNNEPVNIPYFPGDFHNIFDSYLGYTGNFGEYYNTFHRNVSSYINTQKGTAVTEFKRGPNAGMKVTVKITDIHSRLAMARSMKYTQAFYDMMFKYGNNIEYQNGQPQPGYWDSYMGNPNYNNDRGNTFLVDYSIKIENVCSDIQLKPFIDVNSQGSFHPYFGAGVYDAQLFRDDNPRNGDTNQQMYTAFAWSKLSNNMTGWNKQYLNLRNYDSILNKFMLNLKGERQFNHNDWLPLNSITNYGGVPVQNDTYSTDQFNQSFTFDGVSDNSDYMNYLILNYKIKNGYGFVRPLYTYQMIATNSGISGEDLPEAQPMGFENGDYNSFTSDPLRPPSLLSIYSPQKVKNNVFGTDNFNGYFFSAILSPNYMTSAPNISTILGFQVPYAGPNNTPISSLGSRTMISVDPDRKFYPLYTNLSNDGGVNRTINNAVLNDYDVIYNNVIQVPGEYPAPKSDKSKFLYYELYGLGDAIDSNNVSTVDDTYPLRAPTTIDINPNSIISPYGYGPLVNSYGSKNFSAKTRMFTKVMPGDRIDISKLTLNGPLGGNPDPDTTGSFPPDVYSVNKLYLRAVYSDDESSDSYFGIELKIRNSNTILAKSQFTGIPGLFAKPSETFLKTAGVYNEEFRKQYRYNFIFNKNENGSYNLYKKEDYSIRLTRGAKIILEYEKPEVYHLVFSAPPSLPRGFPENITFDYGYGHRDRYYVTENLVLNEKYTHRTPSLSENLRRENYIIVGWYNANKYQRNKNYVDYKTIDFKTHEFKKNDIVNENNNRALYNYIRRFNYYDKNPYGIRSDQDPGNTVVLYPIIVKYELPKTGSSAMLILGIVGVSLITLSYIIYRREFE